MGTILRCSKRTSFLRILTQIELSLQFRAHFADLVFQHFNILKCKSSSRHSAAHFLSIPSPHRGPNLRKQTPHCSDPASHCTPKNTGFAPESVFTCEFTRSGTITLLYCFHSELLCLAYNVVDMMMTWRQDCPWTFVRSAEVFELKSIWWNALRYTACICKFDMSQQWFHWWLDLNFHMYRSIA